VSIPSPRPREEDGDVDDAGSEVVMVTRGGFSNDASLFVDHRASGARGVVGEYGIGAVVDLPCKGLLCSDNGLVGAATGL